jgi:predicted membrane protein
MEFDRRPRNIKGYVLAGLLSAFGKKIYTKSLGETLRRIERAS